MTENLVHTKACSQLKTYPNTQIQSRELKYQGLGWSQQVGLNGREDFILSGGYIGAE